jgi:opacity protein-like surface antigen
MGLTLRNFFLGSVPRAPIPNQIYTLAVNAGLGYHLNDQWTIGAAVGPRLYRLESMDGSGLGIGHCLWAAYQWTPNVKLAIAVAVDPSRDVPVLPAGGLRWEIQTNLTLKLMFPKSGLDCQVNSRLSLRASFVANYAVFRADDDLGAKIDMPQYNDGLGTYRDFLAGVGAEYKIARGISAAIKAGYSFDRQLDYQNIGQKVKFDSSPFFQVGLKYRF